VVCGASCGGVQWCAVVCGCLWWSAVFRPTPRRCLQFLVQLFSCSEINPCTTFSPKKNFTRYIRCYYGLKITNKNLPHIFYFFVGKQFRPRYFLQCSPVLIFFIVCTTITISYFYHIQYELWNGPYKPSTGRTGRCMNHAPAILAAPALIYSTHRLLVVWIIVAISHLCSLVGRYTVLDV